MSRRRNTQLKGSIPILGALLLSGCMLPEVGVDDAVQFDASSLNVGVHDRTLPDEEHSPQNEQTSPVSNEAGVERDARAQLPSVLLPGDSGAHDAGADCVRVTSARPPDSDAGADLSVLDNEDDGLDAGEAGTSPAPVRPACTAVPTQTTLPEDEAPDLTEPPAEPSEAPSNTGEADDEQDEQDNQDDSSPPADTATAEPTSTAPEATATQTAPPPPPATTTAPPATTPPATTTAPPATTTAPPATTTAPPATTTAPPATTTAPPATTPPSTPPTATTPPSSPGECEDDSECDSGRCRNGKCKPVNCSGRDDEDDDCEPTEADDECSFDEDCLSLLCVLGLCGEVEL